MRLSWWARVSAALMILLMLGVATAVVVVWLSNGSVSEDVGTVDCSHMRDARTKASIAVSVDTDGLETPRITADLTVQLPVTGVDHSALLAPADSARYRFALRCLLESGPTDVTDIRRQWRDRDPVVTRNGQWLVVHDVVWVDLWGHPIDDGYESRVVPVGLARVEPVNGTAWRLSLHVPDALGRAEWQVAVHAPRGWLAAPAPLPASLGPLDAAWEGLRPGLQPLVAVTLQLDTRTAVTADSNVRPGIWLGSVLAWLSGVLLTAIGIGMLHRRRAHPRWRLAWPPLIIFLAVMAEWIVRDAWAASATRGTWWQYEWVVSLVAVVVAGICAGLWQIRWRIVVLAVVAAAAAPIVVSLDMGWPWSARWSEDAVGWSSRSDDLWWQAGLANLWTVLIGSILLLAGLCNALRLLRQSWRAESVSWQAAVFAEADRDEAGGRSEAVALSELRAGSDTPAPGEEPMPPDGPGRVMEPGSAEAPAPTEAPMASEAAASEAAEPEEAEPDPIPVWLWLAIIGVACLLVIERIVLIVYRLQRWGWLDGYSERDACCPANWHGWAQIEELAHAMLIVTALVAGVILLGEVRRQAAVGDRLAQIAVVLFVIAVAEVEFWAYGYWIPMWPLLWWVLLRWLNKEGSSIAARSPHHLAIVGLRVGWRVAVPVAVLWTALTWGLYPPGMVDRYDSLIVGVTVDLLWQAVAITFGAGLLGLLWWRLPWRGMAKAVPLVLVYLIPLAVIDLVPRLTGGPADPLAYLKAAVFATAIVATAWIIQYRHLAAKPSGVPWWKEIFSQEQSAERLSFLLTVVLSVLAIVEFISGGTLSGQPGSIEPPRPGR